MRTGLMIATAAALLTPAIGRSEPAATPPARATVTAPEPPATPLLTLKEARALPHGRLTGIVLDFLTTMDGIVNRPKQPAITAADWAPLGALVDQRAFRRVGNFGVRNDWTSYTGLLTQWANSSWWEARIWRVREVPGTDGGPGLVYMENEERSNRAHPVRDDGDYSTLASIAVYEIGADGRITGLHVYDQRPL